MEDLHSRLATQRYIQDVSVLGFCETWLCDRTPDEATTPATPAGNTLVRVNRNATECSKTQWGGTAVLVKLSGVVISLLCSENVEYITVKCRPFYILREMRCMISRHENKYPDTGFIILGDFNHCNL